MKQLGRPKKFTEPTQRICMNIPIEIYEELKLRASKDGEPVAGLIRKVLKSYVILDRAWYDMKRSEKKRWLQKIGRKE